MNAKDLNIRTLALARHRGITFREARAVLGRHGGITAAANRRRAVQSAYRAERARALADKISP